MSFLKSVAPVLLKLRHKSLNKVCLNQAAASGWIFQTRRLRRLFSRTSNMEKSAGLQHLQQAQQRIKQWSIHGGFNASNTDSLPVKCVGVVGGGGTMGSGIVMVLLNAGLRVVLVESNTESRDRAVQTMRNLYSNAVKLKKLSPEQTEKHLSRMIPTTEYSQLKRCDVVIEAVFENLELKKQIFNELDKICPPHTILTSNTSSLDIDQLAAATNRADKVMGTHFFIPVYQSKLLENSYGRSTSPQTVATVMKLGQKIGKFPVLMKNCELFVANRALIQYMWEATLLLEEGADPSSVDTAVEEFGIPMGPFRLNDIIGHDTFDRITTESILKYGFSENGRFVNNTPYSAIHKETFNSGRLGVKVGKGWYEYEKGSRDGFIDEDVLEILDRFRAEHNVQPRIHSKQEIIERCTLSMVHECFRILQDGIISCPDDIDFICVTALGWPKTTGGPLFYASRTGLNNLLAKMKHYRTSLTDALQWTPCELLVELAAQDVPYAEWMSFLEKSSKL